MHAVASDSGVRAREGATHTIIHTTLYDLIAAVNAAIEPGEEDMVAPIVAHLLRAGHAQFVSHIDPEMLCDDQAPTCLHAEECCVPA